MFPSFDDDEHNTSNKLLLSWAPVLLSGLTELDELATALSCRFALDIWTIMQQEPLPLPACWTSFLFFLGSRH